MKSQSTSSMRKLPLVWDSVPVDPHWTQTIVPGG